MKRLPLTIAAALLVLSIPVHGESESRFTRRFVAILSWNDHFFDRVLEVNVDDKGEGSAHLRFSGDKRGEPWNHLPLDVSCRLERRLVGELRVMLQKADVFGSQGWGYDRRGQHLPLMSLHIGDAGKTVSAVVSSNELYKQGSRSRVVSLLAALNSRMSSGVTEVCTLATLDLDGAERAWKSLP